MTFRPALGLSLFSIPALGLLLWLGFWQLDRRNWKQDLISSVEAGLASEAIDVSQLAFDPSDGKESLRYTKVKARGSVSESELYLYATGPEGPGYSVIAPLQLKNGDTLLIDRGFISRSEKDQRLEGRGGLAQPISISGILQSNGKGTIGVSGAGVGGVWTYRDLEGMADQLGVEVTFPYFVVLLPESKSPVTAGQPRPSAPHLEFANNHLSYAVTWFGLAFALICVYIAFHKSQGRLTFGPNVDNKE